MICVISDYNWKNGVLYYDFINDNGVVLKYDRMIFMWYSKQEAIKILKKAIKEKYGNIKIKVNHTENTDKNTMKTYDLQPINGEKSFYNKAKVHVYKNGDEVLQSYDTLIVRRKKDGKLIRLWNGWSVTTQRHIKAFCGLNKAEFVKLPLAK